MRNTTMRDQSKSVKPKQHHSQATSNKIETPSQGFKKLIPRDRTFEGFPKHEPSTTKKMEFKKRGDAIAMLRAVGWNTTIAVGRRCRYHHHPH